MDQGSLLELFESERNPFRKVSGYCGQCAHSLVIETRLYWCHRCGKTGCWDWLVKHQD